MENEIVLEQNAVVTEVINLYSDTEELQFPFGFGSGVEADQYRGSSTTPESESLTNQSAVVLPNP